MTIAVGSEYVLKVNENPTTGFTWNVPDQVVAASKDLFTIEKTYTQASTKSCLGCTGVGGFATFKIKAIAPGSATFTINHARPWEKD